MKWGRGLWVGKVMVVLNCKGLILFNFFSSAKAPQLVPIFSMLLVSSKEIIPASLGTIKIN